MVILNLVGLGREKGFPRLDGFEPTAVGSGFKERRPYPAVGLFRGLFY